MGKTFEQYQAEHTAEPFPLPMPDGTTVPVPKASIKETAAVKAAIEAARTEGASTPFTGLEVLVGDVAAAAIAEAWGDLPGDAWDDVMKERREHFGEGN